MKFIDNWLPAPLHNALEAEWPDMNWEWWHRYGEGKVASKDPLRIPPACSHVLRMMLSEDWIPGDNVVGDWTLHGAGMHAIPSGSGLGWHQDSDHHPRGWLRHANVVYCVNREWDLDCGGELQFGIRKDDGTIQVTASHKYVPNRLFVFQTGDLLHRVTDVRGGVIRRTLAAFFWRRAHGPRTRARAVFD